MPGEFGGGGLVLPREPMREREPPPRQRERAREREPQIEREPAREPVREREAGREREPVRDRDPVREPPRLREPQPPPAPAEEEVDADQNLADMAQRLEAALRRPGKGGEARSPEIAPRAAPANAETAPTLPPRPQAEAGAAHAEVKPGRSLYDSLEKEMANLLGRPSGKS
jgi:hypothetical protein